MAIDLSEYNTVPERIAEAKAAYPNGRFTSDVVALPAALAERFVAVKARFYRTPDDPQPGEGLAWEPVPGTTPYTKNSELQNAETSAWGRALIGALIADAKKGVASMEEVRNRQSESVRGKPIPAKPGKPQGFMADPSIDEARLMTDHPKECPDCGSKVFDNRDTNRQRAAEGKKPMPAFKCTNRSCSAASGEPWISWEASFFDAGQVIVDKGTGEIVSPPVARDDYGPDEAPF